MQKYIKGTQKTNEYLICEEKESQEEEKEHAGGAIIKQIIEKKTSLSKEKQSLQA